VTWTATSFLTRLFQGDLSATVEWMFMASETINNPRRTEFKIGGARQDLNGILSNGES
jgi:hypothetical protein